MTLSLRAGALLAAGTLAVHEVRYLVGYGQDAATAARGHGYLTWLAPLVALALAAACGAWFARIGRRGAGSRAHTVTWVGASGTLTLAYLVQETLEGLAAHGHAGPLAHGGWIALPLALAVGGLVTLMLRGASEADRAAAAVARPWSPLHAVPSAPVRYMLPAPAPVASHGRVLARRLAGRAPPVSS